MGTCYYLIRRDTRTAYGLGKAWFLSYVFGGRRGTRCDDGTPMSVTLSDIDTIVELIAAADCGDFELEHDVSIHYGSRIDPNYAAYWRAVAVDIVDWSEGQPFELHSEHSGLYEEISMDAWDTVPWRHRLWLTGDRHDRDPADTRDVRWEHASRDEYAQRRCTDEAFRRGNVWIDRRARVEAVQTTPAT